MSHLLCTHFSHYPPPLSPTTFIPPSDFAFHFSFFSYTRLSHFICLAFVYLSAHQPSPPSVSTHHLAGFDHPPPFQLSNPPTTTISLKSRPELSLIYVLQNFRLTRWITPASWFKNFWNTICIRKFDDIVMIRQKHQTKIYKRKQRRHIRNQVDLLDLQMAASRTHLQFIIWWQAKYCLASGPKVKHYWSCNTNKEIQGW